MNRARVWAIGMMAGCMAVASAGENSPQFRGPDGTAVLTGDQTPPSTWGEASNIRWKRDIPGEGWSAPIIWGNKVFLTAAVTDGEPEATRGQEPRRRPTGRRQQGGPGGRGRGYRQTPPDVVYRFTLHCLDLNSGKTVWEKVALEAKPRISKHRDNTYATETPVTDGKRVYAYFGMHGLFAFDLDGNLVWKKDLGVYPMAAGWGTASSPLVHDGLLFLQIDNEKESFLTALDAATGKERWRVARDEKSNWSNPMIWQNKLRTELVTSGYTARSYDPKTGKLLWELTMSGRAASTPLGLPEVLYIGTEDRARRNQGSGGLFAVRVGAQGDITPEPNVTRNQYVQWLRPKDGPPMASPLVYQGYLYTLTRNGMVNCYDASTGKPAYERERLRGARSFWASPWAYAGHVFCLDDNGTTHVLKAGPEFEVLGTNELPGRTWATAALTDSSLLIRSEAGVYCISR